MNTACPTKTTRITLLSTKIVLFFAVMVVPFISLGQTMNQQVAQNAKKMNPAEQSKNVAVDISKKLKSILPDGWSLKREKNIITIKRNKPIEWYGTISLPCHRDLAELKAKGFVHSSNYTITLEFFPPMSKVVVDKLVDENRRIEEQYHHDHPQPKNAKPSIPWELQQSLHHIPDILTKQYSVLVTPSIKGWLAFYDEHDKKECEGVEQDVRRVLRSK